MNLTVKGKQLDVGDALRTHIAGRLDSIFGKYFGDAIEANVVMSRDAYLYRAQVSVHVGRGILLQSEDTADAPYAAFDLAAERVAKRLRRYKRRLRDHHRAQVSTERAQYYVLEADTRESDEETAAANGEEHPVVVAEMNAEIPTLSVSEAVMRLDLSNNNAILFRNRKHGGLNMVYRRGDGHVGWVDPKDLSAASS